MIFHLFVHPYTFWGQFLILKYIMVDNRNRRLFVWFFALLAVSNGFRWLLNAINFIYYNHIKLQFAVLPNSYWNNLQFDFFFFYISNSFSEGDTWNLDVSIIQRLFIVYFLIIYHRYHCLFRNTQLRCSSGQTLFDWNEILTYSYGPSWEN